MPLPLMLGVGAALAGALGVATGVHGAVKIIDAKDTLKLCQTKHEENLACYEVMNKTAVNNMNILEKKELNILKSLKEFSNVFEKIHNRPEYKTYKQNGLELSPYSTEEFKKAFVNAGILLGTTAMETAGGFAAAGAATTAVMAFGTIFAGTAIASISGAAAASVTLAVLGYGAIAAGGGGPALETTMLVTAAIGVGLMVGGLIFHIVGSSLFDKADQVYEQVYKEEEEINKQYNYLLVFNKTAEESTASISMVQDVYLKQLNMLTYIVHTLNKTDWSDFSKDERLVTENTALLVGLLYNMGKAELVQKTYY